VTLERLALEPGDRVLLLAIPDPATVRRLAALLTRGILVGIGSDEEVRAARRDAADLANVMFHAASPGELPWQDGFFSCIVNPGGRAREGEPELARVLAPGGRIVVSG
jgi:hypothetical protein